MASKMDGGTSLVGRPDALRRGLDLALGGLLGIAATPVILLVAAGSALALRAWPFFTQERIGRDGRRFRFLKIRTLPVDVPSYVDKHQLDYGRIPAFCRLLRRLHLDELPQLFLVVRGHMSLVGPRPEMAHLHRHMPEEFRALRVSVRPGCTGLWQISTSCAELIGTSPEYDEFYLAQRSLRLDLWILGRTVANMLGSHRYITLDDIPRWAIRRPLEREHHIAEAASESSLTAPAAGH